MTETFPNARKATILQILSKANRSFLEVGRQLNYKVLDSNPMNDTFNLEITPDDSAKLVVPSLSKYKQDFTKRSDNKDISLSDEPTAQQVIKEVLFKHIFDIK